MIHRRQFLTSVGGAVGAAAVDSGAQAAADPSGVAASTSGNPVCCSQAPASLVDFRYSPTEWQHIFCLPGDVWKGVIGERGDLRYGHRGGWGREKCFPEVVEFFLNGMGPDMDVRQELEAPGVPIIHTRIDRPEAYLAQTTFATNQADEGRVDNVILEVRPRTKAEIHACPMVAISSKRELALHPTQRELAANPTAAWNGLSGDQNSVADQRELAANRAAAISTVRLGGEGGALFMATDAHLSVDDLTGTGARLALNTGSATGHKPLRYFLRFPQAGQDLERIKGGLQNPGAMLTAAREYWHSWKPFQGEVSWRLPRPYSDFLVACARNLRQLHYPVKNRNVFWVGPTTYSHVVGLPVVDSNFILEAARYLGYDAEAWEHVEAEWAGQIESGQVVGAAGATMWKDTAIAAFTLVRQSELSQDEKFHGMRSNLLGSLHCLKALRDKARSDGSANGRYGLLPRGYADGGIEGVRSEFTNTVWALAGLRAATEAATRLGFQEFEPVRQFYGELRQSFFAAAREEMRRHPGGFDYLPMLMKDDPQWTVPDEWDRPRPQSAQWALCHAICPGLVFDKNDPIVKGHIALMQACTQEDVPAETGWIPHEGLWAYNAMHVAQVYLWAGLRDWADSTFHGYLNHASPLYAWREEQPLRGSVVHRYVGDMPHNWASAECIRYLRHMLAFEDGQDLRLLAGIGAGQLAAGEPYAVTGTPTRFGRLNLELEPHGAGWRMKFERLAGPAPGVVQIPGMLGDRARLSGVSGAKFRQEDGLILVEPSARSWTAEWI